MERIWSSKERQSYKHQACEPCVNELGYNELASKNMSSNFSSSLSSIPGERGFIMIFLNVVALPSKIDEICHSMINKNIDLIAFNETRLDLSIPDGLIQLDGYEVIRKDWSRNRGGVCIYLRNSINYKIRSDLIPPKLETVCLQIMKPHSKPFIVTTIYRPPNAPAEFFDHFEKLIKQIDNENKEIYILGDLNCNLLEEKAYFNAPTNKLNSLYELYQLSQLIKEPTRITMKSSSLIDHVVTNTPEKISHSGVIHTGISDHSLIYAIRKIKAFQKTDCVEIRNMKNFNESKFIEELYKQHWEYIYFSCTDPNAM